MRRAWPGMARTIYGDHERFLATYYEPYPGEYRRGREGKGGGKVKGMEEGRRGEGRGGQERRGTGRKGEGGRGGEGRAIRRGEEREGEERGGGGGEGRGWEGRRG